jgi:glycosyltransferase involved in cell wall biosynthesis
MPRVSVLLPTHNRADIVGLAIQSVLDQTETDFELLVVADGCTDGTVAVVSGIGDPRIRLYDLPKAPYFGYANRNIALREARGEYVAFAAHDDLLFPDHLRLLIDRLEATGREWIYSRPLWVSTDGVIVPSATNLTIADELEYFLTLANSIPAACVLYRRTCLDRFGYWPEDVPSAADWRHWIAIIEGGGRQNFAYLSTPTCLHFSADWRRSRNSGHEDVRTWLDIADGSAWWPDVLRYTVPSGIAEQHVIAAAMRADRAVWVDELRAAIDLVLDRVAWDDIRAVRPQLRARDLEHAQLRAHLNDVERALTDARQMVEDIERALADSRQTVEDVERALADSRQTVGDVERALADSRQTIERLNAQVAALDAERLAQHQALDAAEASAADAIVAAAASAAEATAAHQASTLERARAQTELRATHAQLLAYQERLSLTLASTSWRITAPMRTLKQVVTPNTRTSR